jgi:death on curing protein
LPKNEQVYRLWPAFIENAHDVGIGIVWPGVEPVREETCLDLNLLHSASEQPYQECFGRELYPSLSAKAAYLFVHIAGGHIFSNGNKRTAVLCLDMFLLANAQYLTLTNDEVYRLACFVASSGEKGIKFERLLEFVTSVVTRATIPLSGLRKIDAATYRGAHRQKRWLRSDPINTKDAALTQRGRG